jgi:hypothetical protein
MKQSRLIQAYVTFKLRKLLPSLRLLPTEMSNLKFYNDVDYFLTAASMKMSAFCDAVPLKRRICFCETTWHIKEDSHQLRKL